MKKEYYAHSQDGKPPEAWHRFNRRELSDYNNEIVQYWNDTLNIK